MLFTSLFDASRKSPFPGVNRVQCEEVANKQLVPGRSFVAAAAAAPTDSCEFGSTKYFLLCGLGGIISCGKCLFECAAANTVRQMTFDLHTTGYDEIALIREIFEFIRRFHSHSVDPVGFGEVPFASEPG